jgi:hypothetical protein
MMNPNHMIEHAAAVAYGVRRLAELERAFRALRLDALADEIGSIRCDIGRAAEHIRSEANSDRRLK